jgi:nucleotide-binding universal stress UspA family protein
MDETIALLSGHAQALCLDSGRHLRVRARRDRDRHHQAGLTVAGTIGSILVGTDGSDTAAIAVGQAINLAAALQARLQIVSAYEPVSDARLRAERLRAPEDIQWTVNPREDVLDLLKSAEREAHESGVQSVETFARVGDAADAILDVAEEQRADLIVIGNKGMTGATRFLLGSVPNKVSHHAPCSVLIVRTT